ncbi:MAG: hypothetical protein ACRD1H_01720, partial [Vicinamibacterales bacterium]
PDGLVTAAGAIGERSPSLAADIVEHDLVRAFATAIIVRGSGTDGDLAVRGQIRHEDGETTRFSVPFGSLYRIAITPGERANLTIVCDGGFTIGGRTEITEVPVGRDGDVQTGQFGILIDARGRPVGSQLDHSHRVSRMQGWLENLGVKL